VSAAAPAGGADGWHSHEGGSRGGQSRLAKHEHAGALASDKMRDDVAERGQDVEAEAERASLPREVEMLADKLRLSQNMVHELEAANAELDKALHVALAMSNAGKVSASLPPSLPPAFLAFVAPAQP
jgi:hypothetical protein